MTTVTQLFRHPLKSHGREELRTVALTAGQSMPFDRQWAVAHDRSKADGTEWAQCVNFSIGTKAPKLAAIDARLDPDGETLHLTHPERPDLSFRPNTQGDRLIDWVQPLVPQNRAMPDRVLRLAGRGFTDTDFPSVSLCNLASHRAVEGKAGTDLSNLRWRGNIWFDSGLPWEELDWIGKEIAIGGAVLGVREPIRRCLHTAANPATGERDVDTLGILNTWDHQDFGIYAEVIRSGPVAVGDRVEVA
ncbi:molybdenum cofactor biosysynthesis protein [Sulfitobacter alexandrii]|uniref:Molybdenum cofactor biosysynthesis protein n=1 Tax=Sulfitobacter alexandrii TaxID=1917485 RepID=A0A1J0WDW8_9RHOB|nr:MOSC N-terminal beta barrel domain-containing protein [Sulfitobacter alexandrii]APE42358.1 molybdenum cofactor biosysynthesis protein [Sulfitobacter alexandrii]